jgi:hypothetical protein
MTIRANKRFRKNIERRSLSNIWINDIRQSLFFQIKKKRNKILGIGYISNLSWIYS